MFTLAVKVLYLSSAVPITAHKGNADAEKQANRTKVHTPIRENQHIASIDEAGGQVHVHVHGHAAKGNKVKTGQVVEEETDNSEEASFENSSPAAEAAAAGHSWQTDRVDRVVHVLGGDGVVGKESAKDGVR